MGPTQPPVQWVPGVKRPGRGADHPPPSKRRGHERVGLYLWASVVACYRENLPYLPQLAVEKSRRKKVYELFKKYHIIIAVISADIRKKHNDSLNLFYITNCKFCSLNCLVRSKIVFLITKHKFSHFNSDLVIK